MRNPFDARPRSRLAFVVLVVLLGLGVYYWFRTEDNRARLSQRNLRDLARIARAIEAKTNNLETIAKGLEGVEDRRSQLELVPHALNIFEAERESVQGNSSPPTTCRGSAVGPDAEGTLLWLHANGTSLCVEHAGGQGAESADSVAFVVEFDLVRLLRPVMTSAFFEKIFLAEQGRVILQPGATAQRLRRVPEPSASDGEDDPARLDNSTAYPAEVGGREFMVFLQPIDLQLPGPPSAAAGDDGTAAVGLQPTRWQVGGLVDASRFRAEAWALDPAKLAVLLVLVVFTVLAWPFLKLWSMGARERVATRDLLFFGFALALGSGIVAICVLDLAFYLRLVDTFDEQLGEVAERMADNVHTEIGLALGELNGLSHELDSELLGTWNTLRTTFAGSLSECAEDGDGGASTPDSVTLIYRCLAGLTEEAVDTFDGDARGTLEGVPLTRPNLPLTRNGIDTSESQSPGAASGAGVRERVVEGTIGERFPYFDMAIWVNPAGYQVAKWSPSPNLTPRRSVDHREYYQRVKRGELWRRAPPRAGGDGAGHGNGDAHIHDSEAALDTSQYFLEVIRSINTGEILVALSSAFQRPDSTLDGWAAMMTAKLASLDRPVLPPGFGFAVIDADGQVLFHSLPERSLEADFIEETGRDAALRSSLFARAEGKHSLRYLGRDVRLYLTPIKSSPLSLIVYQDRTYPRTIALETLTIALTLFGAFVILLLLLAVGVQVVFSRRLSWAWPGGDQDPKHGALLLAFVVLGVGGVLHALVLSNTPTVDRHLTQMLATTYLLALLAVAATLVVMAERPAQAILGFTLAVLAGSPLVLSLGLPLWAVAMAVGSAAVAAYLLYVWSGRRHDLPSWLEVPPWFGHNLYPLTALCGLLVVGTLPAALSFALIADDHMELLVKHTQLRTIEALRRRDARILAEFGPPEGGSGVQLAALQGRRDGLARGRSDAGANPEPLDVVVRAAFETCYRMPSLDPASAPRTGWHCGPGPLELPAPDASLWRPPRERPQDPLLHRLLDGYLPFFTDVSVQTRHLYHDHPSEEHDHDHEAGAGSEPDAEAGSEDSAISTPHDDQRGWWWRVQAGNGEDWAEGDEAAAEPILLMVGPPWEEFAAVSLLPGGYGFPRQAGWWIGLLIALVALFYLIRLVAREVFLVDLQPTRALPVSKIAARPLPDLTILVTPWEGDRTLLRERDDVTPVNLRRLRHREGDEDVEVDPPSEIDKERNRRKCILLMYGLDEVLDDPERAEGLLAHMEKLGSSGRRMLLVVDRDPDDILFRGEPATRAEGIAEKRENGERANDAEPKHAYRTRQRERWARLLSSFTKIIAGRPASRDEADTTLPGGRHWRPSSLWTRRPEAERKWRNERLLRSECAITTALQPVDEHVRSHPEFGRLSDEALTHMVRDGAEGQYRRIWNGLREEEKMTLAQIADGAVSLPKRPRTIAELLSRGLLDRRPDLRLMNRSFTHFVREQVPSERVAAWEAEGGASAWQMLRRPLFIILVAIALFLFVTQRDVFNTGVAFLTAVAAGLPSLFRLLGSVRGSEARR